MTAREHTYPQRLPKNSPLTSVRIAWEILDSVRPGVIPPIIRFRLAEQIASACRGVDAIQQAAVHAIQLRDFLIANPETIAKIADTMPDLTVLLTRLAMATN